MTTVPPTCGILMRYRHCRYLPRQNLLLSADDVASSTFHIFRSSNRLLHSGQRQVVGSVVAIALLAATLGVPAWVEAERDMSEPIPVCTIGAAAAVPML